MSDAGHISTVDRSQDSARAYQTAKSHISPVDPGVGSQLNTQQNLSTKSDTSSGQRDQRHPSTQQRYTADRRSVPQDPGTNSGLLFDVTV